MTDEMDNDRSRARPAHAHALEWLDRLASARLPPRLTTEEVVARLDPVLPDAPTDAATVVDQLAAACDPRLTAIPGGRFFGFVIGAPTRPRSRRTGSPARGTRTPACARSPRPTGRRGLAEACCWTCSACRPAAPSASSPGHDGQLHLPGRRPGRGAAPPRLGRGRPGGWSARPAYGSWWAPSGTTPSTWRCATWASELPEPVAADDQGRIDPRGLAALERATAAPRSSCLQAGNVHSGAFDPFAEAIEVAHDARRLGARRRRLRPVRRRLARPAPPRRGLEAAGLLGHRRPQDPQRPLRLRARDRARRRALRRRWACTATT